MSESLWIMVAGPYRAEDDQGRQRNLQTLNESALELLRRGHVPVIGVNLALPLIAAGGSYDEVMMPLSLALAERCDACLRIGGASAGADQEVERFRAAGKPVYLRLQDVP